MLDEILLEKIRQQIQDRAQPGTPADVIEAAVERRCHEVAVRLLETPDFQAAVIERITQVEAPTNHLGKALAHLYYVERNLQMTILEPSVHPLAEAHEQLRAALHHVEGEMERYGPSVVFDNARERSL